MTFIESLKRIFLWIPHAKKDFFILFIREIFVQIFGIISIIYLSGLLEIFQKGNFIDLKVFLGSYILITSIHSIIRYYTSPWGHATLKHKIESIVTGEVLSKILGSDRNKIESLGTGRVISLIMRDTNTHVWIGLRMILQFCVLIVSIGLGIYLFVQIELLELLIPLVVVIICIIFSTYKSKISSHADQEKLWILFKEYDRMITRQVMSQSEILAQNTIKKEIEVLKNQAGEYAELYKKGSYRFAKNYLFAYTLLIFLYAGMAYYLGKSGYIGRIETLPTIAGIFGFIAIFHSQIINFVIFFEEFITQFIQVQAGWKLLDSLTPIRGYSTGLPFSPTPQNIEIQNISYGYNESKVFDNFSLSIKRGKKTALVGASGGGKTTLMKLIAGYLHPESGSISVLGNKLSETALKTYYPHIGYLTQDPSVFDATIRENLVSALPSLQRGVPEGRGDFVSAKTEQNPQSLCDSSFAKELTEQKLISALRLAHCDFVFDLEHGLDTEIGERGVRLSGGQKQRLAIAKIFLKDPEIILLDEPTSALDSFSEEAITEALDTLFKNRTVIIVAHRLQTVRKADDIIVLESGTVVERGNHTDLVEKGGIYNRMLELQSGF